MKDYLKDSLSDEEKAEITAIIWRVAKKYKLKMYAEQKNTMNMIENLDLLVEDDYDFEDTKSQNYSVTLTPLTELQKTNIVNKLNMLMDELRLFDLKRTLTFNEKLVFFFLSVERLKSVEVMKLLSVDRKTIYNRKKSIEIKLNKTRGGLLNGK